MKRKKVDKLILRGLLVLGIGLLPLTLRKPGLKDWLLVYLWNGITNGIIDKFLVTYKIVKYPVRLLPTIFKTNILFDYFLYPIMTMSYNQVTEKDGMLKAFFKLFYFTVPMMLIELWAERKTGLVKFGWKWKWYHSFISLNLKSLATRLWISLVRKMDRRSRSSEEV